MMGRVRMHLVFSFLVPSLSSANTFHLQIGTWGFGTGYPTLDSTTQMNAPVALAPKPLHISSRTTETFDDVKPGQRKLGSRRSWGGPTSNSTEEDGRLLRPQDWTDNVSMAQEHKRRRRRSIACIYSIF